MNHNGLVSVKTADMNNARNDLIVGYTRAREDSENIIELLRDQFRNQKFGVGCPDSKARVPPLIETEGEWPQVGAAANPAGGESIGGKFSNLIAVALVNLERPEGDDITLDHNTVEQVSHMVAEQLYQKGEDPCNPF